MQRPNPPRQSLQLVAVALLAITGVHCASAPRDAATMPENGLVAYSVSELDREPRLIRCSQTIGASTSQIKENRWEVVTVQFTVTERGTVDPASVFATRSDAYGVPASSASIAEAMHRAQTCRYQPGSVDGQAVRTTMERRFGILTQ
jgi:hypothetical protein